MGERVDACVRACVSEWVGGRARGCVRASVSAWMILLRVIIKVEVSKRVGMELRVRVK